MRIRPFELSCKVSDKSLNRSSLRLQRWRLFCNPLQVVKVGNLETHLHLIFWRENTMNISQNLEILVLPDLERLGIYIYIYIHITLSPGNDDNDAVSWTWRGWRGDEGTDMRNRFTMSFAPSPSQKTSSIVGMFTIPRKTGDLWLLYPHYSSSFSFVFIFFSKTFFLWSFLDWHHRNMNRPFWGGKNLQTLLHLPRVWEVHWHLGFWSTNLPWWG